MGKKENENQREETKAATILRDATRPQNAKGRKLQRAMKMDKKKN